MVTRSRYISYSKESEDKLRKGSKVKGTKLQFILEISKHLVSNKTLSHDVRIIAVSVPCPASRPDAELAAFFDVL